MKSLKYIISLSGGIVLVCMIICLSVMPVTGTNANEVKTPAPGITETQGIPAFNGEFLIISENNRIVVYKNGEAKPYEKTDIVVTVLPIDDQKALARGLEAQTEIEMKKILQDYN
ncbi:MAG: hypothetical protein LBM65_01520 [Oscillospiraceae bacterium]|jgi:hypothetical protein|nr:hypothetical protein [Oscillospiraceae bacterium]